MCFNHNLLTCSPVDGHLGCIQCLALMNGTVLNIYVSFMYVFYVFMYVILYLR